jgi:hypothetical protein|tara:strand:- start:2364 stop:3392 length:1029 start_codon:yes stop_codon:yes gene_type:complete
MSNGLFSSLRGLLQNPIQSYRDARQPGGLLAPVTSLNQFLGDPRVNIGLDLAAGRPLGESLERTAAIQQSLAPEAEEETFSILTELEKRTFGLDPNKTYQKSNTTGKVSQVGTAPTVNIEGDKAGETEEQKKIGEYFGESFIEIAKAGDTSFKNLQDIDTLEMLLENTDFKTGSFGELRTTAEKIGSEFGLELDVQNVPAAEAFRSLSGKIVLGNLQFTKGAVSDREMSFFGSISPGLLMSKDGNALVLDIAKRKAKLEIDYKNEAVKWIEVNGSLRQKSKDGTSWTEFTNNFQQNNPLFSDEDREVIKNLSDTIDPQFAGNDVIELNGKNYIKVGQDYYEL